jgi:hypothetical protein
MNANYHQNYLTRIPTNEHECSEIFMNYSCLIYVYFCSVADRNNEQGYRRCILVPLELSYCYFSFPVNTICFPVSRKASCQPRSSGYQQ